MKLRIKVTKEILKQSMYCGTDEKMVLKSCAIALACREIFPDCFVDDKHLRPFGTSWEGSEKMLITLPYEARIFIRLFDSLAESPEKRADLSEVEFEVNLPQELIDSINIDQLKELLKTSETLAIA